jgi:hypothetical protein
LPVAAGRAEDSTGTIVFDGFGPDAGYDVIQSDTH